MKTFEDFSNAVETLSKDELDTYFDSLEAIYVDHMIGNWKGGVFPVGSAYEEALKGLGWYGKRFKDENQVEALILETDDGLVPYPEGSAVLRRIEFRGKVSAAMIYDKQPIIDHFRKIDENRVMGIMDHKGKIEIYFYLTREEAS